jgi:HEAT repeat protein
MASEVSTLATRVRGQLARRGDANAQALLRTADGGTRACDAEEQSVRSEALRALMRIDPEAAMPKLRAILEQRDACILLRRSALQILGSRREEASFGALVATARSDSSAILRSDAVTYVAQYGTDASATALEAIARNDQSEPVRRAAARNLVGHASARARTAARSLIEDNSVSDNIRAEMLSRYTAQRSAPEDAVWLRAALPRVTSARVKQAVVGAVGRIGRTEDQQWLMTLSTNDQEPSQVRQEAFRHVSRTMSVPQLSQAYDNAGSSVTREQILRALNSRQEAAAGDKMLEVVRRGTDPRLRALAIELLSAKKDPRLTAALLELIDR